MEATTVFPTQIFSAHNNEYLQVTRKGFIFCNTEDKYGKLVSAKDKQLEKIEEKKPNEEAEKSLPAYKVFFSFAAIAAGIILAFLNAENVKQSLVGLGNSEPLALAAGAAFTIFGILLGEQLNEGLVYSSFNMKRVPTGKFYRALVGACIYLILQISLAFVAANSSGMHSYSIVLYASCIALLELGVGFLFARTSFIAVTIFFINVRLHFLKRRLSALAYQTEMLWQKYLHTMQQAQVPPAPETEAVQRARAYYAQGGNQSLVNN